MVKIKVAQWLANEQFLAHCFGQIPNIRYLKQVFCYEKSKNWIKQYNIYQKFPPNRWAFLLRHHITYFKKYYFFETEGLLLNPSNQIIYRIAYCSFGHYFIINTVPQFNPFLQGFNGSCFGFLPFCFVGSAKLTGHLQR